MAMDKLQGLSLENKHWINTLKNTYRIDRPFDGWTPIEVDIMAKRVARIYGQQKNVEIFLKVYNAGCLILITC